jgi:thymidylate kinase
MSDYEVAIDAYIFPCDPEIAKERIAKDLNSNVERADSIQFINEQYRQYRSAIVAIDNIELDFYRNVERVRTQYK